MGNICFKEDWSHLKIEESYRVKKDNVLGFPCCMKNEKYVIRDTEHGSKTRNVEELFDEVDKVISVSSTTSDCSSKAPCPSITLQTEKCKYLPIQKGT